MQLVSVLFESHCDQFGLAVWLEPRESDEKHSGVNEVLSEDQLAKILICRHQDRVCAPAVIENGLIVDSRVEFSDKQDIMTVTAEPFDNVPVDALIRDDFQPVTVSTGYTTDRKS